MKQVSDKTIGIVIGLLAGMLPAWTSAWAAEPAAATAWPSVVDAARKEGKVVLYTMQVPPVIERIKADFTNAYPGIALEAARVGAGPMVVRVDQERASGAEGPDVMVTVELVWLERLQKEGQLAKPMGPASRTWPAAYMWRGASPVLALEPLIIAYNTNLIKTPVTGYRDLMKPEFKGKLGISVVQSIVQVAWYEWLEKLNGPEFLPNLAALAPRFYNGTVPNTQAVASGEIVASLFSNLSIATPLVEQGAPMRTVLPTPALGFRYAGSILARSPRPNAAQVLVEYLMSPRGQTMWNGQGQSASPLPNIPGSPDASKITAYDPTQYGENAIPVYMKKFDPIFKK